MRALGIALFGITLSVVVLVRCGSDSGSSGAVASNPFAETSPLMAVSSPTAADSTTSASLFMRLKNSSWAFVNNGIGIILKTLGFKTFAANETTAPTELDKPADMKANVVADFSQTPAALAGEVPSFEPKEYDANCFNASHTLANAQAGTVSVLYGDGGIAYATASASDTTACMAAYINALIAGHPNMVNKVIKLQTLMLASAKDAGESVPGAGASTQLADNMPTVSGLTVSDATLERLADDSSGRKVFKTSLSFTSTTSSKTGSITLWHTPKNADNTESTGLLQAVLPHTSTGAGNKKGLSIVYDVTGGVTTFILKHCANQATTSSTFFAAAGPVDFDAAGCAEDLIKIIGSFNDSTGAATVWSAWQAGTNDGASRITLATVAGTTDGAAGTGYFGYGNALNTVPGGVSSVVGGNLTDATTSSWIEGMYCAWTTGLANGTLTTKAQKQTMTYSAANGKWVVGTNAWQYARRPDCTTSSTFDIQSHPISQVNTTYAATNSDLVNVSEITTSVIPSVTAPSFTKP